MADQRILLVEGNDDSHVVRAICEMRHVPLPETRAYEGRGQLLTAMTRQVQASTGERDIIGLVADADDSPLPLWGAIRNRLHELGYEDIPSAKYTYL